MRTCLGTTGQTKSLIHSLAPLRLTLPRSLLLLVMLGSVSWPSMASPVLAWPPQRHGVTGTPNVNNGTSFSSQQDLAKPGKWPKQVVLFPQEVMPPNYPGLSRSQQPLGGRQKREGLVLGNVWPLQRRTECSGLPGERELALCSHEDPWPTEQEATRCWPLGASVSLALRGDSGWWLGDSDAK